jgi:4-amino-4-deoxy-L-arabinose transferase-like glycosyltransferase
LRAFILRHKKMTVAVLSSILGLATGYFCFFTQLVDVFVWISNLIKTDASAIFFILFSIALGVKLAEDRDERAILAIIGLVCSLGMFYLYCFIMFFIATGRFLEYYRHYPW